MLEELRALVEAEQLRMAAIPKVFELHEIDDALAVRPVAWLSYYPLTYAEETVVFLECRLRRRRGR